MFSCVTAETPYAKVNLIRKDRKKYGNTLYPGDERSPQRRLPNTEGIIATAGVSSEIIAKALRLKVIVVNGAGYDDIDVAAASALQVPVYNIPDLTANAAAELALSLMLDVARRVTELNIKLRANPFDVSGLFRIGHNAGITLSGKTLGIVGLGDIGTRVARIPAAPAADRTGTRHALLLFS